MLPVEEVCVFDEELLSNRGFLVAAEVLQLSHHTSLRDPKCAEVLYLLCPHLLLL